MDKNGGYVHSAPPGYYERPTSPADAGPYSHRLAPASDLNGGGEEFVFESPFENPVYLFRGAGRLAGQFLVFGSGPAEVSLHPIGAPQGLPIVTGDIRQYESNEIDGEGVIVSG